MKFGKAFERFFSSNPEETVIRADDMTDYFHMFDVFESRFEQISSSSLSAEKLLSDLEATFSQTELGKDYRVLKDQLKSLESAPNPSGEVGTDLGKINIVKQQISKMEESKEFQGYKKLTDKIKQSLPQEVEKPQKVA